MGIDIPYVPSSPTRLQTMLDLAQIKPDQRMVDLGCGDGRICIAFAKLGAIAHGFEINPDRVKLALNNIAKEKLTGGIQIFECNFWDKSLADYDVITLFGITGIMDRLEKKLKKEMKPTAKIISNYFTFPHWSAAKHRDNVYLYTR